MAAKPSLFAVSKPADDSGDDDDYSGDALPAGDEEESDEPQAGPFEAYAETVLDAKAPMEDRVSALREAITTLLEESGHSGMPSLGGLNSKLGGMGGG